MQARRCQTAPRWRLAAVARVHLRVGCRSTTRGFCPPYRLHRTHRLITCVMYAATPRPLHTAYSCKQKPSAPAALSRRMSAERRPLPFPLQARLVRGQSLAGELGNGDVDIDEPDIPRKDEGTRPASTSDLPIAESQPERRKSGRRPRDDRPWHVDCSACRCIPLPVRGHTRDHARAWLCVAVDCCRKHPLLFPL